MTGPVRISGRANPTNNNNTTTTDNPLHGNSGKSSPKSSSAQDKKSTATATANPINNGAGAGNNGNGSGKGDTVDPPSSLALLQQMPQGMYIEYVTVFLMHLLLDLFSFGRLVVHSIPLLYVLEVFFCC